jgi:hypothetical protein
LKSPNKSGLAVISIVLAAEDLLFEGASFARLCLGNLLHSLFIVDISFGIGINLLSRCLGDLRRRLCDLSRRLCDWSRLSGRRLFGWSWFSGRRLFFL